MCFILKNNRGRMKKKYAVPVVFLTICLMSLFFMSFSRAQALYPIFDSSEVDSPRNLRTTTKVVMNAVPLDFQGLNYLKASGSGQFTESNFKDMLRYLAVQPQQLIVFDLRQESHGFINGSPVSWTDGKDNYGNLNKTRSEIEIDEYQRLRLAAQAKKIVVNPVDEPTKLAVYTVKTERSFVEELGSTYIRLPVTDHNRPSNEVIDQFIEFVKTLPNDQWLHFHCRAGKGRTTTFLTLFDMMKNAQQVHLEDILARQAYIGGANLTDFNTKFGERKRAAEERLEFVKRFYAYCREVPDFQINWSTWIEKQQTTLVNNP